MFAYTLEAAVAARRIDRLVVSSDDLELGPLAAQYGVEFFERPASLCSAESALEDAVHHVLDTLMARDRFQPELVIVAQGNVPVRRAGRIDEVIERLEALPQATAVCTAQPLRQRPEWAKRLSDPATGLAVPYLPGHAAFRTQDYPPLFLMDGAVYGVRRSTLEASRGRRVLHAWFGERLHLLAQEHAMYSLEVDYPDQVALAVWYLLAQRHGEAWIQQTAERLADREVAA